MSKIFNVYSKNNDGVDQDKVWFQSSNVKYSECLDKDNELKTLKVVFNNGTQYEYKGVRVQDYLLFREDASQGKALNKYIKANGYEYEKLENADLDALESELNFRMEGGMFVLYNGEKITLKDNKDVVLMEKEVKLTEAAFNTLCSALEAVGKQLYTIGENFVEDKDNQSNLPFENNNEEKAPF